MRMDRRLLVFAMIVIVFAVIGFAVLFLPLLQSPGGR
jgi:hypothetical protein